MAYASIEKILVAWLDTATAPTVRVVTERPPDLAAKLPVVQVVKFGGAGAQPTLAQPNVDVDCYAATRGEAEDLAGTVYDLLHEQLPGQTVAGAVITRVEDITEPHLLPYDITSLRRYGAAYRITVHH